LGDNRRHGVAESGINGRISAFYPKIRALDPIAEYELNRSIIENSEGKTVIFISHRLSTTRMADRIYMFDGGEITESGSHEQLMAQNGKYAQMYRVQAKKYRTAEA
jgi:ATP-binding cassette subfamily B protein